MKSLRVEKRRCEVFARNSLVRARCFFFFFTPCIERMLLAGMPFPSPMLKRKQVLLLIIGTKLRRGPVANVVAQC